MRSLATCSPSSINKPIEEIAADLQSAGVPLLAAPKQVIEAIGCSYGFLWQAIQRRELPHLRIGRHLRLRRRDVAAWLASHHIPAQS
ncbi:MAG: excisionase family DNA-binding protein [Planctomycetaceae bacterium]|nr:excisionase family DNA-binding protein [Planctomycetaceae bacterium]